MICLAEQEPDNTRRKIFATGEEPLKVVAIARCAIIRADFARIDEGFDREKHNSAAQAQQATDAHLAIWSLCISGFFPSLVEEQSTLTSHLKFSAVVVVVNSFAKRTFSETEKAAQSSKVECWIFYHNKSHFIKLIYFEKKPRRVPILPDRLF